MTPYVIVSGTFQMYHIYAYASACRLVEKVSNSSDGKMPRCHELAVAVLTTLAEGVKCDVPLEDRLVVHDGKCGAIEHSWLQFQRSGHVLDVYRPGVHPQVHLIDSFIAMKDYVIMPARRDIRGSIVKRLCQEMER